MSFELALSDETRSALLMEAIKLQAALNVIDAAERTVAALQKQRSETESRLASIEAQPPDSGNIKTIVDERAILPVIQDQLGKAEANVETAREQCYAVARAAARNVGVLLAPEVSTLLSQITQSLLSLFESEAQAQDIAQQSIVFRRVQDRASGTFFLTPSVHACKTAVKWIVELAEEGRVV